MSQGAFHPHASGLYVPQELARQRQVWTKDERRTLDRAAKLCASRGVGMVLACRDEPCKGKQPLEKIQNPDGGYTLRCPHMDRVFQRGA